MWNSKSTNNLTAHVLLQINMNQFLYHSNASVQLKDSIIKI